MWLALCEPLMDRCFLKTGFLKATSGSLLHEKWPLVQECWRKYSAGKANSRNNTSWIHIPHYILFFLFWGVRNLGVASYILDEVQQPGFGSKKHTHCIYVEWNTTLTILSREEEDSHNALQITVLDDRAVFTQIAPKKTTSNNSVCCSNSMFTLWLTLCT